MSELIELQKKIEELRQKLYEVAQDKKLTDREVVGASQILDAMLNEYQRMLDKKI